MPAPAALAATRARQPGRSSASPGRSSAAARCHAQREHDPASRRGDRPGTGRGPCEHPERGFPRRSIRDFEGAPVMIDAGAIAAAEQAIRPHIRRTPIVQVEGEDLGSGSSLVLKLELLQQSGSFKARGAFANLLLREVPAAGAVAASGGNHGAAGALAARKWSGPARIFVPRISEPAKVERIREYGATLDVVGDRYADALAASQEFAARSGAMQIHAFDQRETLLGTGTLGKELEEQAPEADAGRRAAGGR